MQECHVKEFLYNSMLTYHFLEHAKLLNWLINDEIHICHDTIPTIENVVYNQSLVQAFFYYMPCIWFSWFAHRRYSPSFATSDWII